jgi:hypothetical protein
MGIKIEQEWHITSVEKGRQFPGATIAADDGATYSMFAPRAKRVVAAMNALRGVTTKDIKKLTPEKIRSLL